MKAAPGDVDTGFKATLTRVTDGALEKVVVQPDGKILVAGLFSAANERGRNGVARYNPDRRLDTGLGVRGRDSILTAIVAPTSAFSVEFPLVSTARTELSIRRN